MQSEKPKIEFSMLLIWTIIFTGASFFVNPVIFSDKTPELIRLPCVIVGFLFFMGFAISWFQWMVWWLKGRK